MSDRYHTCRAALAGWAAEGRLRTLPPPVRDGMLNLSTNDYLGIGSNTGLWQAFLHQTDMAEFGGGSCSSRLLTGNSPVYADIEDCLCRRYGRQAALVLNSGYHANTGILPAVARKGDLILADKLVHASIIDGMRLSDATWKRFPHNDLEVLEKTLARERTRYAQVIIVTESVFSMDGDKADLPALVSLKKKYECLLYVDEAHAFGVFGAGGLGCAEAREVIPDIDFLIGTFGKAIASQGAFVVTDRVLADYFVNTVRPLIFSTALPSWSLRWTAFVLERLSGMDSQRRHLAESADRLRAGLTATGRETAGDSHIVPLYVRDRQRVLSLSHRLYEAGIHASPIRPPTVPAGTERLRFSLTAAVSASQIDSLLSVCSIIG